MLWRKSGIKQILAKPNQQSFSELFTPKRVTVLCEGYRLAHLRADAIAGLTVAGAVVFINRMSASISVETHDALTAPDVADSTGGRPRGFTQDLTRDHEIAAYRITGAFFFGAASSVSSVLEQIADQHKAFIVDLSGVPFLDSTGANALKALANRAAKRGVYLVLAGPNAGVSRELAAHQVAAHALLAADMTQAVDLARNAVGTGAKR